MQKPMKPLPLAGPVCYPLGMQERIIKLESLAAMQDETLGKLNEELFRQQQDITLLKRQLETLEQRLAELGDPDPFGGNERPPHY
jgi:SlyX protein